MSDYLVRNKDNDVFVNVDAENICFYSPDQYEIKVAGQEDGINEEKEEVLTPEEVKEPEQEVTEVLTEPEEVKTIEDTQTEEPVNSEDTTPEELTEEVKSEEVTKE